ncbi:RNA-binding protein 25-like isoform X1 [Nematostella vectensis]|uniref:RNA-binding protein 25-like isoform X1 n=1 Tax=Nematostella vectensis TaxID=45351 RepID=UPI0020771DC2|nr:RNA-binding protein 25-like isoform X1 [Nematostella vectensis]
MDDLSRGDKRVEEEPRRGEERNNEGERSRRPRVLTEEQRARKRARDLVLTEEERVRKRQRSSEYRLSGKQRVRKGQKDSEYEQDEEQRARKRQRNLETLNALRAMMAEDSLFAQRQRERARERQRASRLRRKQQRQPSTATAFVEKNNNKIKRGDAAIGGSSGGLSSIFRGVLLVPPLNMEINCYVVDKLLSLY